MKALFDKGCVTRNDANKPFVYGITEAELRTLTLGIVGEELASPTVR